MYPSLMVLELLLQGYSFVAPSIIFGENEFTKRLVANKPSEHRPAPGAVDYAALFEVNDVAKCTCYLSKVKVYNGRFI